MAAGQGHTRAGRGEKAETRTRARFPWGCCLHPGLAQDPPEANGSLSLPFASNSTRHQMSAWAHLTSMRGSVVGGLRLPGIYHQPQGNGWSMGTDEGPGGIKGSLELAEDVCVFRGDAGGLQDCHTESKDAAQLQVIQSCLQRPVQHRLFWAV